MVSGDRSHSAARHSVLLVWRWLEEMGRHGLWCRVICANLHVCNGPLKAKMRRASVHDGQSGLDPRIILKSRGSVISLFGVPSGKLPQIPFCGDVERD